MSSLLCLGLPRPLFHVAILKELLIFFPFWLLLHWHHSPFSLALAFLVILDNSSQFKCLPWPSLDAHCFQIFLILIIYHLSLCLPGFPWPSGSQFRTAFGTWSSFILNTKSITRYMTYQVPNIISKVYKGFKNNFINLGGFLTSEKGKSPNTLRIQTVSKPSCLPDWILWIFVCKAIQKNWFML